MTNPIFYKRITGSSIQGNAYTVTEPNGTLVIANGGELRLHDGSVAGGNPIGGGGSIGSFGTDKGIGADYASNNPAILFSDDDMIIRTGGTAGHGTIGAMYIASAEELIIGHTDGTLTDATSLGAGDFTDYLYFDTNGIEMTTARGTVQFGYNLEAPGLATHFHINKLNESFDLFFGDDSNYFHLPAGGGSPVIGANDGSSGQKLWTFGRDGSLTLPQSNSGAAVISAGTFGLQFIANSHSLQLGTDGSVIVESAINSTAGTGPVTINSNDGSNTHSWTFGTDGGLTVPQGGYITAPSAMGSNTVIKAPVSNTAILENNSGYNNVSASDSNVTIQTSPDSGTTLPTWVFGTDASTTIPGIVTLPNSGQIGSITGGSYGTEIKNTDGYVGGVQLNWTDQSLVRVDSNGINIITGGNGGPTWHFSGGDGGTLFTPGGVNIAGNRTTNNSNPFSSTSGAPVVIYTATSLSIIAVEIVVRALVDYGGSVELATIHAVKSPVNNTANIIVTGRVRQDGGSGSYGDTIYTVSLDGSNFLQVTAQPYGSNDANFIVTVTEFN